MKPAKYYRQNKNWQNYLGKVGKVVVATMIRVAAPTQENFLPFAYAVVEFNKGRGEFMGVGHEQLKPGDKVQCVLRKVGVASKSGVIAYGIKVQKV